MQGIIFFFSQNSQQKSKNMLHNIFRSGISLSVGVVEDDVLPPSGVRKRVGNRRRKGGGKVVESLTNH